MVRIERLLRDIEEMGKIGALPGGGNSRPAMSSEDLAGREYLISAMEEAGMVTWTDPAGNVCGRREADSPVAGDERAILLCSHIDTVPAGGRYDGVVGVFGALECVRSLNESGVQLNRPVEIVAFNDEEERFLGFLGSYAVTGRLSAEDIAGVTDHDGVGLVETMRAIGLHPDRVAGARRERGSIAACLEVHIEQGPVLDRMNIPVGVVRGVKGDYRRRITFRGRPDHAGAPKGGRRDAFMAFHWFISRIITLIDISGNDETTCTVGRLRVEPNVETIQPGLVEAAVDVRSPDGAFLRKVEREMRAVGTEIGEMHGVTFTIEPILTEDPVLFDDVVVNTLKDAARSLEYPFHEMFSGAGHDAQVLAAAFPTGMLFIPSVDGRSHCPEEYTEPGDIEKGIHVLYHAVMRLGTQTENQGAYL